jgi:hypothetical protein
MPAWLWPAVKLILPHVGTIVSAARPAFTKLRGGEAAAAHEWSEPGSADERDSIVQKQISELQAAASQNATHIKELAEQLRLTVTAIEQAAQAAEKRMKRLTLMSGGALLLSLVALGVALYA